MSHMHKLWGALALVGLASAAPTPANARNLLLGSSFGVPGQNYTFDYLVLGGGQAGLTMAARLSENPSLLVGVVEAGSFYEITNGNISQIPAMDTYYAGKAVDDWQPGIDWGFITTPQAGALNASVHYPRGKTLGGNSARNYMTYHAGTAGAYANWATMVGDDSYQYENFYPYFKKSQDFSPPDQSKRFANATPQYDATALGKGGPLSVIFPNYAGSFGTWVQKGLTAVGMNPINGFQSGKLIGSAYALATINFTVNTRESSETAFLQPALQKAKPNLIVFPSTLAKQILFDANKKVTGAQVDTGGLKYILKASKEVILSAGSFQSPQLLMVSGIGPAATLKKHGISVLADRPGVGQNMTDHVLFGTTHRVNLVTGSALSNPAYMNEAVVDFDQGRGPLTNPNVDMFGWEKIPRKTSNLSASALSDLSRFPADWPEIEYIAPGGYFGFSQNYQTQPDNPHDGFNYATIISGLVAPLSRGTVDLASADTATLPLVNPNWLTHPTDRALAIAAFRRTRDIWNTKAMQSVSIGGEYFPGVDKVASDAQVLDFVMKSFSTIFHAACTCQMGRVEDPHTVVDARARVVGVQGLRVVDASAFPLLPPGHPMATIYALAEKIADDILKGL